MALPEEGNWGHTTLGKGKWGNTTLAFDFTDGGSRAHNKSGRVAGLPEKKAHARGLYPFPLGYIVTASADL